MTSPIFLPERRSVKIDRPRMIDFGGALKPIMGGPVTTLMRLGTRFAIDITIPLMRTEPDGRTWGGLLCQAKLFGAAIYLRQDGLDIGMPGSPMVNGAGQTGMTLNLRGFRKGYCMRFDQAFSLIVSGKRYVYRAAADTVAAADGTMALPIYPMIRKIAPDGAVCEVERPVLQGSLAGNEVAWTRMTAPYCDFGTISISEDE